MEFIQLEEGGRKHGQENWVTNQWKEGLEPIKDWHVNVEVSMHEYHRASG